MITLPSHTSHAHQPLDVACFKPFNITFKRERNTTMFNRNYIKPYKIAFVRQVNNSLDHALIRNITSGFKGTRIWPFDPRAMDENISLNILYTLVNQTRGEDDDDYHSNEDDCEQQWIEHATIEELINIGSTTKITIDGLFEDQPRYYVNMLQIPTIINHAFVIKLDNMVENLEQFSLDEVVEFKNSESSIQEALTHHCHNLLSLAHLLTRKDQWKRTISGLFSKPSYDFKKIFEHCAIKGSG